MTKEAIQLEEKRTYYEAVNNLLENIKNDYAKWTTWEEGIERFNNGIITEDGIKYTKVIQGTCVWGFIAKADGVVKGLPCKKGDVFKAADWRGPARYTRGNIFAENQAEAINILTAQGFTEIKILDEYDEHDHSWLEKK